MSSRRGHHTACNRRARFRLAWEHSSVLVKDLRRKQNLQPVRIQSPDGRIAPTIRSSNSEGASTEASSSDVGEPTVALAKHTLAVCDEPPNVRKRCGRVY